MQRRRALIVASFGLLSWLAGSASYADDDDRGDDDRGQRVQGRSYSSTTVPPVTDDPPKTFLADADKRTDGEPTAHTGLDDYELKNGIKDDDKKRWAATDYIRWLASGATLVATGQVHDSDPAATSEVSSQAWGALMVDVEVTKKEGDVGTISAENRIFFSYTYVISGPRILDAKVLLSGSCVDINGERHSFSLSDVRSESITERVGITRMRVARRKTGAKVSAGAHAKTGATGPGGGTSLSGSVETIHETEEGETINTSIERSLPGAGGQTGTESAPLIEHSVSGKTVLKQSYAVFSEGAVSLSARGSKDATTVVLLKRFKIENSLKVFKKAEKMREPTDIEPGDGGDSAGEADDPVGGAGSGEGTGSGDGRGSSEEGDASDSGSVDSGESDQDQASSDAYIPLDGLEGLDGFHLRLSAIAPRGLADEPGGTTGELHLVLSEPAPRELVFSVLAEPFDAITLLQGDTLTIPEGSRFVGGSIEAIEPGSVVISVHLLEVNGALSGREGVLPLACASSADRSEPLIYACGDGDAWHAGSGATIVALRGREAPALTIGRLGFAEYDTTSTSVSIAVHDPNGVLPPLPSTVTIPAGEAEVRIELVLQDVAGTARLTLSSGGAVIDVYVVSRIQGWDALPIIRIPVGATAVVPFELRWPERAGREVVAVPVDGSIARPIDGGGSVHLVAGATLEAVTVRGVSPGRTMIRYETEGLADLNAIVEVVPARVRFVAGQLRISGLPTGTSGTIALAVSDGTVISDVSMPPEASAFLSVTGIGTDRVVLQFTDSPDLPAVLALGLTLDRAEGADATGFDSNGADVAIDVDENLEEDIPPLVRNSYRIRAES